MSRTDVARAARLVVQQLRDTHPALLFPALLLLTVMTALAVALLLVAALAVLAVGVAASLAVPSLAGMNILLGSLTTPRKAVAT